MENIKSTKSEFWDALYGLTERKEKESWCTYINKHKSVLVEALTICMNGADYRVPVQIATSEDGKSLVALANDGTIWKQVYSTEPGKPPGLHYCWEKQPKLPQPNQPHLNKEHTL